MSALPARTASWQRFLDEVHAQAQQRRFEATWPDTWALDGTSSRRAEEHHAQTRQLFRLLEAAPAPAPAQTPDTPDTPDTARRRSANEAAARRICPPCNGDCLAGDDCPSLEHALRELRRTARAANSEQPQPGCPPCNQDCDGGRQCPVRLAARRKAWHAAGESIERRYPRLWAVYVAVGVATIWLSTKWPWGFGS